MTIERDIHVTNALRFVALWQGDPSKLGALRIHFESD